MYVPLAATKVEGKEDTSVVKHVSTCFFFFLLLLIIKKSQNFFFSFKVLRCVRRPCNALEKRCVTSYLWANRADGSQNNKKLDCSAFVA